MTWICRFIIVFGRCTFHNIGLDMLESNMKMGSEKFQIAIQSWQLASARAKSHQIVSKHAKPYVNLAKCSNATWHACKNTNCRDFARNERNKFSHKGSSHNYLTIPSYGLPSFLLHTWFRTLFLSQKKCPMGPPRWLWPTSQKWARMSKGERTHI